MIVANDIYMTDEYSFFLKTALGKGILSVFALMFSAFASWATIWLYQTHDMAVAITTDMEHVGRWKVSVDTEVDGIRERIDSIYNTITDLDKSLVKCQLSLEEIKNK